MAETKFTIYEDQENRVPGVGLRGKRADVLRPLGNNGPTRTAFGLISSQNSNLRVQPSRSAKQVSSQYIFQVIEYYSVIFISVF